jgi:hypothetical protein
LHAKDRDVLAALVTAARSGAAETGTPFEAAICNERGAVYRVVRLYGVAERANFEARLQRIGFSDRLLPGQLHPAGYCSIFST